MEPRKYRQFHKQLMSKKILNQILDDFSFFGSLPFYVFMVIVTYFLSNYELLLRLIYTLLIGTIVVIIVKNIHYKDRPQREEFTIFMEKMVASSFPSTHSTTITTLAIMFNLAYPNFWLLFISLIICVLVYLQRYISKKHFVIDIIGGIIISIILSVFVIRIL
jgi:membrane-associated phospholipid phosphatase